MAQYSKKARRIVGETMHEFTDRKSKSGSSEKKQTSISKARDVEEKAPKQ